MFEPLVLLMLAWPFFFYRPDFLREACAVVTETRPAAQRPAMELRIDVHLDSAALDDELSTLHERLERSGLLRNCSEITEIRLPGLIFHHREADGEHYIYVEDVARGCLAGYTVFNRLIEVNRRQDRFVRAPHSKYAQVYQRRGIATAVYQWALDQGFCLISSARQSQGANALWRSLGIRYRLEYIELRDKCIESLGPTVDKAMKDRIQTRMLLLAEDWDGNRLRPQRSQCANISAKGAPSQGDEFGSMRLAHNAVHLHKT